MASNDQATLFATYPPDINCFVQRYWDPDIFKENNCSVTDNMQGFLNLTGPNVKPFLTVYCLNAPPDDVCPFGFCPNPDIAGPLVRIASESTPVLSCVTDGSLDFVTGFCLGESLLCLDA